MELDRILREINMKKEEEAEVLGRECKYCGPGRKKLQLSMFGLDVEAIFLSMSSKKTGEIVRKRIMRSNMDWQGFNWKVGLSYIVISKHLTSNLGTMWKILPYRRKVGGTEPSMSSRGMQSKDDKVEEQWVYKTKELTKKQIAEVVGRCAEIAVRTAFENFTYNFGGRIFLQKEGGPIGNRLTMAW